MNIYMSPPHIGGTKRRHQHFIINIHARHGEKTMYLCIQNNVNFRGSTAHKRNIQMYNERCSSMPKQLAT